MKKSIILLLFVSFYSNLLFSSIQTNKTYISTRSVLQNEAAILCEQTKEQQRLFDEFQYAAVTWKRKRKIIVKAEHTL